MPAFIHPGTGVGPLETWWNHLLETHAISTAACAAITAAPSPAHHLTAITDLNAGAASAVRAVTL
jgi:hypothetical protein